MYNLVIKTNAPQIVQQAQLDSKTESENILQKVNPGINKEEQIENMMRMLLDGVDDSIIDDGPFYDI